VIAVAFNSEGVTVLSNKGKTELKGAIARRARGGIVLGTQNDKFKYSTV
jgi:hypothetical protein